MTALVRSDDYYFPFTGGFNSTETFAANPSLTGLEYTEEVSGYANRYVVDDTYIYRSNGLSVYKHNISDGDQVDYYTYSTHATAWPRITGITAYGGTRLYVQRKKTDTTGDVVCLDGATLNEIWSYEVTFTSGSPWWGTFEMYNVVDTDNGVLILIRSSGGFQALKDNNTSGSIAWTGTRYPKQYFDNAAACDGSFFYFPSDDAGLYDIVKIDVMDGSVDDSLEAVADPYVGYYSTVIDPASGVGYAFTDAYPNDMVQFDLDTMESNWTKTTPFSWTDNYQSAILPNGGIVITKWDANDTIFAKAYDIDGDFIYNKTYDMIDPAGNEYLYEYIADADGRVYLTTTERIICLNTSGDIVWQYEHGFTAITGLELAIVPSGDLLVFHHESPDSEFILLDLAAGATYPTKLVSVLQSVYPQTPKYCFADIHFAGSGFNSPYDDALGVGYEAPPAKSIVSDVTWSFRYRLLAPRPAGTLKVVLNCLSYENSQFAKVRVKWASVIMGQSPSAAVLNDEGVTTIEFGPTDAHKYIETKIALDAGTVYDGSMIVMDLVFVADGWTMMKPSSWLLPILVVE